MGRDVSRQLSVSLVLEEVLGVILLTVEEAMLEPGASDSLVLTDLRRLLQNPEPVPVSARSCDRPVLAVAGAKPEDQDRFLDSLPLLSSRLVSSGELRALGRILDSCGDRGRNAGRWTAFFARRTVRPEAVGTGNRWSSGACLVDPGP